MPRKERAKKQKEETGGSKGSVSLCSWFKPQSKRDQEFEKENKDDARATPPNQVSQASSETLVEHREQSEATDDSEARKLNSTYLQKDQQEATSTRGMAQFSGALPYWRQSISTPTRFSARH